MAMDNVDIKLDANGEDAIKDGDFEIGDGIQEDCFIIMKLNSGALKSDPVLAPNIIRMMNSHVSVTEMKQTISLHMARDNKMFKKLEIKNGIIDFEI